ncbi:MAG: outer membrane lipoprotein-sorting protein [Bacteroidota bacterium]
MKKIFVSLVLLLSISTWTAFSQNLTGIQIMKKNDAQFDFKTEVSKLTMELINQSGNVRTRTVDRFSMNDDNRNMSSLIRFLKPADVRGTGFLSIEQESGDETRYLYLPALRRSRRISAGEESDSFMGTDLTYEDLSSMDFDDYSYKLIGNKTINSVSCFVIEIIPASEKRKKITGYSKRVYYVSHDTFVVYQVDYYDKHGDLFKQLRNEKIKEVPNASGYFRAYEVTMENFKTKHKTVLRYEYFKINTDLDSDLFTVRNLERWN